MIETPRYDNRCGVHGDILKQVNVDGTALYRTRGRPCDGMSPFPPTVTRPTRVALRRRPITSATTASKDPRCPPRGGVGDRASGRARRTPRAIETSNKHSDSTSSSSCVPVLASLSRPLAFYTGGLRVVVPPITMENNSQGSGEGGSPPQFLNAGAEVVLSALPSIPVVWPRPDLPNPDGNSSNSNAFSALSSSPQGVAFPAAAAAALSAEPTASFGAGSAPLSVEPTRAATAAAAGEAVPPSASSSAAVACSPERHALHARWGIAYCSVCGLSLQTPSTGSTPKACPLGPHPKLQELTNQAQQGHQHQQPLPRMPTGSVGGGDRYCMLCGAELHASPGSVSGAAAAAGGDRKNSPSLGRPSTLSPELPSMDALTRRDLQSVDVIMAHLLENAYAHGGKVQPPCGLPNCQLCNPERRASDVLPADALSPRRHEPAVNATNSSSSSRWWWDAPLMCGSPAVAIIHNHYYH